MSGSENQEQSLQNVPQEGEWISGTGGSGGEYEQGFKDGLAVGVHVGYNEAIERVKTLLPGMIRHEIMQLPDIKSALSDGLRNGSSGCGRMLVNYYRYGKSTFPDVK
ncbi:TPA: hypothetical protein KII07_000358 [Escherichia coli]|uniref:hypothetical protein n=1 Tax=Citrobacter freundii TaxID=546 RepID=UPI001903A0D1|nr:hypothetical protein [Citrobacter freundii]MBJ9633016.1 hypothetical protein [Citrobacter freundii]HBD2230354.1 hypothetical protein [Escherichia coli]